MEQSVVADTARIRALHLNPLQGANLVPVKYPKWRVGSDIDRGDEITAFTPPAPRLGTSFPLLKAQNDAGLKTEVALVLIAVRELAIEAG